MAKVIRAFRERFHNFKRYNVGDEYPEDDKKRVAFLVKEGFLAESEKPKPAEKSNPPNKLKRKKGADTDVDPDG